MKKKYTILHVDDDVDLAESMNIALQSKGYKASFVTSANRLLVEIDTINPDLIILDVNLEEEFSGFELLNHLRSVKKYANIPVIILSGVDVETTMLKVKQGYHRLIEEGRFSKKVFKHVAPDGTISVEYPHSKDTANVLEMDKFLSKPVGLEELIQNIEEFLDQ
jgi:CheY-like chemotaxis protein